MAGQSAFEFPREAAGVALIGQADVIDLGPFFPQLFCEMPHGREQEGDLLLVVADVSRLIPYLDEEDHVRICIEVGQAGDAPIELVAQNETQGPFSARIHTGCSARHTSSPARAPG